MASKRKGARGAGSELRGPGAELRGFGSEVGA
jgi:hypothetical protein